MSGFSSSGNPFVAELEKLLSMLGNTVAYKDLLEHYAKIRSESETALAKSSDALSKLRDASSKHEEAISLHNKAVRDFQSTKDEVLATQSKFDSREAELRKRDTDLVNDARVHAQAVDEFEKLSAAQREDLDRRENIVAQGERDLVAAKRSLAAKEKEITTKLARLKEIVG